MVGEGDDLTYSVFVIGGGWAGCGVWCGDVIMDNGDVRFDSGSEIHVCRSRPFSRSSQIRPSKFEVRENGSSLSQAG
jgi:hypothetical protein